MRPYRGRLELYYRTIPISQGPATGKPDRRLTSRRVALWARSLYSDLICRFVVANGVMGPFSWSPGDHVGAHGVFPTVCCNSDYTWKGQGPARTTF